MFRLEDETMWEVYWSSQAQYISSLVISSTGHDQDIVLRAEAGRSEIVCVSFKRGLRVEVRKG